MGTTLLREAYPVRKKWRGCDEEYSSVDEFKQYLAPDLLSSEANAFDRWVFWSPETTEYSSGHDYNFRGRNITEKITHLLRKSMFEWCWKNGNILVQFWAPQEVEGRRCLTTLHQPFAVVGLSLVKGLSWVRKKCMQHYYSIEDEADEQGPPGRVFRNGNPESTPDILLYSTKEFPLRDFVVGCGQKYYHALPIFDVHHSGCVGILEFIHGSVYDRRLNYSLIWVNDYAQEVGLRLVHDIKSRKHSSTFWKKLQEPVEIREMLELAVEKVPQIHIAQVWIPCTQCANNATTNFSCMELAGSNVDGKLSVDNSLLEFQAACKFHNIQNGQAIAGLALSSTNKWCFCQNVSVFSISEYPMAHYARRARLSSCFTICLSRKHNGNDPAVFLEFFLQPRSRDGASFRSILYLLLRMMEKKLESFEITSQQYLGVEPYRDQLLKEHIMAIPMEKYDQGTFSVSEFKDIFPNLNLSCLQEPGSHWIFWTTEEKELQENRGEDSSMPQLKLGTEEIKNLLSEMLSIETLRQRTFLIQFWAPKIIGKSSFLSTSEQPFALCGLQKGLCWYRKQCSQHLYYIGDGGKEEELGPPGRVFLNGQPEASPDIRLYSQTEFPLRDHVVSDGTYLALPLFNSLHKQCVGILEFVGFPAFWDKIEEKLKKFNLRSTHFNHPSSMQLDAGQKQALSEIEELFQLVAQSPHLQAVSAWISSGQCASNNIEVSSMEWKCFSTTNSSFHDCDRTMRDFTHACEFLQVHTRKGIFRKVIEAETKLYFCQNLCSLSICELPMAHYAQVARLDICFAICLKSSYTGNSLHIIEFFLSGCSKKYEYSRTLCFLLSTMEQMLKSFKVASGKQLGEELILEVTDVVIEAKFQDATVNFDFRVSQGLEKLMEEVGKRLNLKIGEFKLKYVDEDDNDDDDDDEYGFGLISLTCDEDLHLYIKNMKSLGKTTAQVWVHLVSEYTV